MYPTLIIGKLVIATGLEKVRVSVTEDVLFAKSAVKILLVVLLGLKVVEASKLPEEVILYEMLIVLVPTVTLVFEPVKLEPPAVERPDVPAQLIVAVCADNCDVTAKEKIAAMKSFDRVELEFTYYGLKFEWIVSQNHGFGKSVEIGQTNTVTEHCCFVHWYFTKILCSWCTDFRG